MSSTLNASMTGTSAATIKSESREQIVYGCSVVDATVPKIVAHRHQGRAAFSSAFERMVPSGILSVGLQSPMVDSALASRYTSHRATCPRSWTSEPSNLEQAPAHMLVQASQNCPHRHDTWMLVWVHLTLSVARRRHPTAYAVHCGARNKTSVHRNLCTNT